MVPGEPAQVVQSYGLESLIGVSARVIDVREFTLRRTAAGARYKQTQHYPHDDGFHGVGGIILKNHLEDLWGAQAESIISSLAERGFCELLDGDDESWVLTSRFRNLSVENFYLGLGTETDAGVYNSLDALLWVGLPDTEGVERFLSELDTEDAAGTAHRISDMEYWFRQGVSIVAVRFREQPSPELILLIDHKRQVIQQERMQNFFHVVGTYNSDSSMWMNESNRNRRFFSIIEHLLVYSWRPFDMARCEVSIDAAGDEGLIASGTLWMEFSENGSPSSGFDHIGNRFPPAQNNAKEFVVNDVALGASRLTSETSTMSIRMVSRSSGNVDPRQNILTHNFVKLFIESVGKLIDVIMPVIRQEEALSNLQWRSFLDTQRLRNIEYGENLHCILNGSLKLAQTIFGVSNMRVFSEDREIVHMLELFARMEDDRKVYQLADRPLTPDEILKEQLLIFPIREIPGGRVLLYMELPQLGERPLYPEIANSYLTGTKFWSDINEEALLLGITDLGDFLFFIVTECLAANPKAVLENLVRRLPVRGTRDDPEVLMKLSERVMNRNTRFFDFFATLSAAMESGLAYMRGRRDNLTGLYNRQHFASLLNEYFSRPGFSFGLIFIDMDNFKIFNDAVSHGFGDKILSSLANRMIEAAESIPNAVPGRFGGDEFCFSIGEAKLEDFQDFSIRMFQDIADRPIEVTLYLDDRPEGPEMEINLMGFLYRLLRPDVGSRQASRTEYIEMTGMGTKDQLMDIWKYYRMLAGESPDEKPYSEQRIVDDMADTIEDKILYNKIFFDIDEELRTIIYLFVNLQMNDFTTSRIRESLIKQVGNRSITRLMQMKVSGGLAHSSENRLRSTESLFKAADSRAYLAKHNGRNCLFGIDGRRLA